MSETGRALESTWQSLREERDELTAHLYPDLQRLQELQANQHCKKNKRLSVKEGGPRKQVGADNGQCSLSQEIAKEKLELETKLRKEHFLFKRQLEDYQKGLLEVETVLLTGNINRKARATKNIVGFPLKNLVAYTYHAPTKHLAPGKYRIGNPVLEAPRGCLLSTCKASGDDTATAKATAA